MPYTQVVKLLADIAVATILKRSADAPNHDSFVEPRLSIVDTQEMIMKKFIVLIAALGALMSACTGSIRVPGDHHGGHDDKKFCPPGQAKKGKC